ncbi:BsuBI/PstI family type II restriction endonuclease [Actinomyces procaprae]|uniref:BsuBI/PstI family type II restriction endonuclease n=1 Tax=Actinomyces procaprae TaxID=2560010 RepID=UPI0010A25D95|nr:BsuBI/PstI family type II restriction endonuclease [Actinomyces procaprae]
MSTVQEAQAILRAFDFDRQRTNEQAGRTLLALAGLDENSAWADATNKRMGVRQILDWMRGPLNHPIAENTRETIRRFVLHQFVDVGFCLHNDDDPSRATNSSKNNYRLNPEALLTIRLYGTPDFGPAIEEYVAEAGSLAAKYQAARDLARIPVTTPEGDTFTLKAGGQNVLIKAMVEEFCTYFVPGGEILYVGDADQKLATFERERLAALGVDIDERGKMPDLVVYQPDKNWLFLMEAASTHGPVDHIRYSQLSGLFSGSTAGLVYVSCFPDRAVMRRFLPDLAWETEVWLASDPTHMIHLNGERFLGPYQH